MNTVFKLGLSAVMVATLAACSGGAEQRRQAQDDFEYLDTQPLKTWQGLADQSGQFSTNYRIPETNYSGEVGRGVDIRPPVQILKLIPGARYERDQRGVTVALAQRSQLESVWETVQRLVRDNQVNVVSQSDNAIETGWIAWQEDTDEVKARYQISKLERGNRFALGVNIVEWEKNGSDAILTPDSRNRYNTLLTNIITTYHDEALREAARIRAQELVKQIPISLGQDRSGLPVIIARAPYDVLWDRLPMILDEIGFTIENRNRSQGTLDVKYSSPDNEFWQELGIKPMTLSRSSYNILLGDLGNRTSINVTDSDGKPIEPEALASMSPALAAVIERLNSQI